MGRASFGCHVPAPCICLVDFGVQWMVGGSMLGTLQTYARLGAGRGQELEAAADMDECLTLEGLRGWGCARGRGGSRVPSAHTCAVGGLMYALYVLSAHVGGQRPIQCDGHISACCSPGAAYCWRLDDVYLLLFVLLTAQAWPVAEWLQLLQLLACCALPWLFGSAQCTKRPSVVVACKDGIRLLTTGVQKVQLS